MNNDSFSSISSYYDKRVETFGHSPLSCDYGRVSSQNTKFSVIANCVDFSNSSVLDVGCGFADFAKFLNKQYKNIDYHGIDLSPAMIKEAKKLNPHLDLSVNNILTLPQEKNYDFVIANGIFYLLGENAPTIMKEIITKMYQHSRKGIIFNSLSTCANLQESGEYYSNPIELLEWCQKLSPWLVLKHDYLQHDFTILISKVQISQ